MVPQLIELSLELNLHVAYHFGKWNAATPIRRKTRRLSAWFMWERSSSFIKIYVTLTLAGVLFYYHGSCLISQVYEYNQHAYMKSLMLPCYTSYVHLYSFWFQFDLVFTWGRVQFIFCYSFVLPFNYFYNAKKMWYNDYFIKLNHFVKVPYVN